MLAMKRFPNRIREKKFWFVLGHETIHVFKQHNACGGRNLYWITYAVISGLMSYVTIQFIQEITWSKSVKTPL